MSHHHRGANVWVCLTNLTGMLTLPSPWEKHKEGKRKERQKFMACCSGQWPVTMTYQHASYEGASRSQSECGGL